MKPWTLSFVAVAALLAGPVLAANMSYVGVLRAARIFPFKRWPR